MKAELNVVRPMVREDFYGYAGAEGNQPHILCLSADNECNELLREEFKRKIDISRFPPSIKNWSDACQMIDRVTEFDAIADGSGVAFMGGGSESDDAIIHIFLDCGNEEENIDLLKEWYEAPTDQKLGMMGNFTWDFS